MDKLNIRTDGENNKPVCLNTDKKRNYPVYTREKTDAKSTD